MRGSQQHLLLNSRIDNYVYAEYGKNRKRRVVDFVLVHEEKKSEELNEQHTGTGTKEERRKTYEENLENAGLKLERCVGISCENARFTLVNAPFDLLKKQAEALGGIKTPSEEKISAELKYLESYLDRGFNFPRFVKIFKHYDERSFVTRLDIIRSSVKWVSFENKGPWSSDPFFQTGDRSRMVYDLLLRTKYGDNEHQVGIAKLLSNGVYTAAYPLHLSLDQRKDESNHRDILYWFWYKKYLEEQPLISVKNYFGSKIAMYFAWLGFCRKHLYQAVVFGIVCTLYGVTTVSSDIPSNDICGSDGIGAEVMMCPHSYLLCSFTSLSASCVSAKVICVFDNYGTVVFAAIMSILSTLFLQLWKRYHADISWKWGLLDFQVDEETNRPDYEVRASKRFNSATDEEELHIPLLTRMSRFAVSGMAVSTFLVVVIAIVFGVVIYRMIVSTVMYETNGLTRYASFLTFSTASLINLVVILILSRVYTWIAVKLTDWECHQFQSAYDSSYTIKVYLFQFFNNYSSIFYIAFIKGNISRRPGGDFLGMKPEECGAVGCMVELVIQLAVIMIGKQLWNFFSETYSPKIMNKIRQWWVGIPQTNEDRRTENTSEELIKKQLSNKVNSWEQDYILTPVNELFLFDEYVEMVIQFGFVFLFASAFPLAAIFALIRNIFEIRAGAQKYIVDTRRPIPQHAKDIGIWLTILDMISQVAVLSNASIIAFTSDFIPKLVYRTVYQHENLYGYVNNSLSYCDPEAMLSSTHFDSNIAVCRYRDYRHPPCSVVHTDGCAASEYNPTEQWWIVLTFRLGFVLLFVVVISAIKMFIASIIPDMPSSVSWEMRRRRKWFFSRRSASHQCHMSSQYEQQTTTDESERVAKQNGPLSDVIPFDSCNDFTTSSH